MNNEAYNRILKEDKLIISKFESYRSDKTYSPSTSAATFSYDHKILPQHTKSPAFSQIIDL